MGVASSVDENKNEVRSSATTSAREVSLSSLSLGESDAIISNDNHNDKDICRDNGEKGTEVSPINTIIPTSTSPLLNAMKGREVEFEIATGYQSDSDETNSEDSGFGQHSEELQLTAVDGVVSDEVRSVNTSSHNGDLQKDCIIS